MRNFIPAIILVTILFASCDQQKPKDKTYIEAEKVFDEAIEIHDEVMPLMGDIMKLQSTLKDKRENISDEETIRKVNESLQHLEDAHSLMMDWMRNITQIPDQSDIDAEAPDFISPERMLKIQEQSLEEVKRVKKDLLNSISQADSLINNL